MKLNIQKIQDFYPPVLRTPEHIRHILKETIQYQILDFLSTSKFVKDICFIGGTNLRLVHGIDRFSEDLDFDIKNFTRENFIKMTDSIGTYLTNQGYTIEFDDKEKDKKLSAFRRNITFPGLLFENGLSPHQEEKFLIKIESQDQKFLYTPVFKNLSGNGHIFNFPVPPDDILCAMKIKALVDRKKGRDFYDAMFLLSKVKPNYAILNRRIGISNESQLKFTLLDISETANLNLKVKDFEHLLFNKENSKKILLFKDFVNTNLKNETE